MTTRNRFLHAAIAFGLAAGALVAAAPAATAATPECATDLMAITAEKRMILRDVTGTEVEAERQSSSKLPYDIGNLVWYNGTKVSTGYVANVNAFGTSGNPRDLRVGIRDAAPEILDVTLTKTYKEAFAPRLVTGSGRYYVYVVDSAGDLVRWTRYRTHLNTFYFIDRRVVAHGMSGIRALQYSWTYTIDKKAVDFLLATTSTGALKQIRVPWSAPGSETVKVLATSGFKNTTGLSLSFCSGSDNYLSVIAVDKNAGELGEARWFTLYDLKHPKTAALIDRGLVGAGLDWTLHAVT